MTLETLIAKRLAAPKAFRVITVYADGSFRNHDAATLAQAENFASGERRKIGKRLIGCETGGFVKVTSVQVVAL